MKPIVKTNRRQFLARAAMVAAAPCIIPASALGRADRPAPSNRIHVGFLGVGGRGMDHVNGLGYFKQVQMLAVCDTFKSKREQARQRVEQVYAQARAAGTYRGCQATPDFREIIQRPDIDAVVIAAPENWHAIMSISAARCGKDVYCEKAMSLTVAEGRAVVEAVRRFGRVFQTGTQQRSDHNFRLACELARNGYLGRLHTVQVAVPGGRSLPLMPVAPVPADLDYDLWLGPAPFSPYTDNKCSYNWYFIYDYCVGWIQSWGVHHIDIALWGAPALQASRLDLSGSAVFPSEGPANTSITWQVECQTPEGLKLQFSDDGFRRHGCRFIGDKGSVLVDRGGIWSEPENLVKTAFRPADERLYESNQHHEDFLKAIVSRRDPVSPVEAGHAATTLTIISDIATRLGRKLTWDWQREQFINDEAANRMLRRTLRSPWGQYV